MVLFVDWAGTNSRIVRSRMESLVKKMEILATISIFPKSYGDSVNKKLHVHKECLKKALTLVKCAPFWAVTFQ